MKEEEIIQVWEEEREELKVFLVENGVRWWSFDSWELSLVLKSFLPICYWEVWEEDR